MKRRIVHMLTGINSLNGTGKVSIFNASAFYWGACINCCGFKKIFLVWRHLFGHGILEVTHTPVTGIKLQSSSANIGLKELFTSFQYRLGTDLYSDVLNCLYPWGNMDAIVYLKRTYRTDLEMSYVLCHEKKLISKQLIAIDFWV